LTLFTLLQEDRDAVKVFINDREIYQTGEFHMAGGHGLDAVKKL
jgi:hypothetical protein